MFDLSGHVALVTGGNGGIGLGLARGLAKAGASLALWGRNRGKNEAAEKELRELGVDAQSFVCDVTHEEQVIAGIAATVERFGRIDSCFANAGFGEPQSFLKMSLDDWNSVMAVNLHGVFLTFRESVRHMVERGGGGKLVAIGSIGASFGMPRQEHYSATKGAVVSLVKSLAVEFGRHDVQANAIVPGWIETDATAPAVAYAKLSDVIVHRTPAHRWGTPADLEGLAVYLASPESRFHTGDVITVDGGYSVF
jgi:NAD(P)-dependent dehydrogenase (short-subunit alcohol dehydrogenase family)